MSEATKIKKSDYKKLFTLDPAVWEKLTELAKDKTFNQSKFVSDLLAERFGIVDNTTDNEVVDATPAISAENSSPADSAKFSSVPTAYLHDEAEAESEDDDFPNIDAITAPEKEVSVVGAVNAVADEIELPAAKICPICGEEYTTPMCIDCLGKPTIEA